MCCGALAVLLIAIAIISPAMRGIQRSLLLGLGTRLQFLFFAVLVPVLVGEVIKWSVGRGRPFVGGEANAFNFSHFAGTRGLCQLSLRPCDHRGRAGLCRLGAVAARRGRR